LVGVKKNACIRKIVWKGN